jgi:hypothetical protein
VLVGVSNGFGVVDAAPEIMVIIFWDLLRMGVLWILSDVMTKHLREEISTPLQILILA